MIVWVGDKFRRESAPDRGLCYLCGRPVKHWFPWWSGNPNDKNSRPIHSDCMRQQWATEEQGHLDELRSSAK